MTFLQYHEPLEGRYYDIFNSRFSVASPGNFLEINYQELQWLVIEQVPLLEMEIPLWKRAFSSLCPREARHGVTFLEDQLPHWGTFYAFPTN